MKLDLLHAYIQGTSQPFRHSHDSWYQEGISRMSVNRLGLWYTGTKYKQVDVWSGEDEEVPRQQYQESAQKCVSVRVQDGRRWGQSKLKIMARI